jgi:hypothetical protein
LFRFASLFRLPFHAHSLPALNKGFPVCGGCSIAATPPPSHKKTKKNGFFAPLGCLELHEINTNALRLFASFFRRLPRKIPVKKSLYVLAIFQKKTLQIKANQPSWFLNLMFRLFCGG